MPIENLDQLKVGDRVAYQNVSNPRRVGRIIDVQPGPDFVVTWDPDSQDLGDGLGKIDGCTSDLRQPGWSLLPAERFEYLTPHFALWLRIVRGGPVRDDTNVRLRISYDGLVGWDRGVAGFARSGDGDEILDFLIDQEIAAWRAVGPEDSELFLTDEWADRLAPQLAALQGGWREVPRDDH